MGGAVRPGPRTPGEHTVLRLQQAADSGSPVMIPGALDARPARPVARPIASAGTRATRPVETAAAPDRKQLELEREGGGAPSQRRGVRGSFLTRLWRSTLHPTEISVIWSRA
jgi:hypothetical protein